MADIYKLFATACLAVVAPALVASAAQFDAPGIGSLPPGQAKVGVVVGAAGTGAPAGFSVQWMKYSDFVANGSQWPTTPDPRRAEADFSGVPTLNTWEGTLLNFSLAPWQSAVVEVGDLFDETGVSTDSPAELEMNTTYVFRVRALGDGATGPSGFSPNVIVTTGVNTNCTLTQGFWKNHETVWPTASITLGTVTYDQSQLLAILNEPARGNGLILLAHQIIAAELNIAQGADLTDVDTALTDAHALIGGMVIPPIGPATRSRRSRARSRRSWMTTTTASRGRATACRSRWSPDPGRASRRPTGSGLPSLT